MQVFKYTEIIPQFALAWFINGLWEPDVWKMNVTFFPLCFSSVKIFVVVVVAMFFNFVFCKEFGFISAFAFPDREIWENLDVVNRESHHLWKAFVKYGQGSSGGYL